MVGICFQINDWTLVIEENKLYRQDREVSVEPRLVNLLQFLAQHSGEVFCRDELIKHVWDGAFVTDQVVTQSVFELRKILRDGRLDNTRYLVTVPKRGYKLVAETHQVRLEDTPYWKPCDGAKLPLENVVSSDGDSQDIHQHQETESQSVLPFPAAPLTRSVTAISDHVNSEKKKQGESFNSLHRWKLLAFDGFLILVLIAVIFSVTYQQTSTHITKAIDTDLIEFTFHTSRNDNNETESLADGISQKLMADLASIGDYRVQLNKTTFTTGILPGKAVNVRVEEQQNKTYLDVEYRSNTSNRVLFSRQYLMTNANLEHVLRQSSLDLMSALSVTITEAEMDRLMLGLPKERGLLEMLIRANHFINQSDPAEFEQGIALLEKISLAEPNNDYVLSELYIAYNAFSALNPELDLDDNTTKIEKLSQELALRYSTLNEEVLPSRIYEALAMIAIKQDNKEVAAEYLTLAFKHRESAFSYMLEGKLAELNGNLDKAGDAYSRAFFMDTSLETYMLSENLAFYSDLETVAYFMYRAVNPSEVRLLG
ncbi:transcriptional regulator CadC [Aliivibrio finisterrensis]|uniref:lysine decarboxylation/transport transcriptional activator CadC n=1 Tax=Aliivibrio finisterrensis TaxID=511998 RepID=UPI00101F932B|nr:lysine decarboxylation/transport transcriptional activator CadC [Aliivibrio finisterrensis]RYU68062.1 transcriptional regulator CadC [Aliivibrio finisterrensis]RYU71730.1 transcriptional regulator CadC [Aliivibrio finisterrensis]RYU75405.1 transcriptional regulator CadC [Aliivibrio finisterrensis]